MAKSRQEAEMEEVILWLRAWKNDKRKKLEDRRRSKKNRLEDRKIRKGEDENSKNKLVKFLKKKIGEEKQEKQDRMQVILERQQIILETDRN